MTESVAISLREVSCLICRHVESRGKPGNEIVLYMRPCIVALYTSILHDYGKHLSAS